MFFTQTLCSQKFSTIHKMIKLSLEKWGIRLWITKMSFKIGEITWDLSHSGNKLKAKSFAAQYKVNCKLSINVYYFKLKFIFIYHQMSGYQQKLDVIYFKIISCNKCLSFRSPFSFIILTTWQNETWVLLGLLCHYDIILHNMSEFCRQGHGIIIIVLKILFN